MQIIENNIAVIERDTHISKWVKEHKRLDFDQFKSMIVTKTNKCHNMSIQQYIRGSLHQQCD